MCINLLYNCLNYPFQETPKVKKKQYDPVALQNAYKALQEEGMSVYRASRNYGVPESTLRDRTLGLVSATGKSLNFLFDEDTEKKLVDHIKYMASIGYGYSRCDVLYLATDLAISLGKKKPTDPILSNKFYYKFLGRWPDLTTSKPQKLNMLRARCASKEQLSNYFKELGTIMTQNGLHDKPHKIYNIDESALQTEHTPPNVVHDIETKPQSVTSPRSSNVTIIGAGNAIGNAIPPYYIFPGKKFDRSLLLNGTPAGSDGQCSQTGWSNSDTFKTYLEKHFLKYAKDVNTGNPTLILFDGHRSHISLTLHKWAESKNLLLFVLPPHCSHILQPLDVACFGPMKSFYNRESQLFLRKNPGCKITKFNIGKLSGTAYQKALSAGNLTAAFKKTGIFPFNPKAVDREEIAPATIYKKSNNDDCTQDPEHAENLVEIPSRSTEGQLEKTPPADINSSPHDETDTNKDTVLNQENNSQPSLPEEVPVTPIYVAEPIVECALQIPSKVNNFLENRSIVSVERTEKKRNYFTCTGYLGKKKNLDYLSQKESNIKTKKKAQFKPPFKSTKEVDKQKSETKSAPKKKTPVKRKQKKSQVAVKKEKVAKMSENGPAAVASTSGLCRKGGPIPVDTESESELTDDEEPCCVCQKSSPDRIHQVYGIEFVQWAQCDNRSCNHWTHLRFCCDVRVVRRGDKFFCPHCKDQ